MEKQLKTLLDKIGETYLYYTDYNDYLEWESIRQAIEWDLDIYELRDNSDLSPTVQTILNETFTDEELKLIEDNGWINEVEQRIYDNDVSDPLNELIKRTRASFRYDLGIDIYSEEDLYPAYVKLKRFGVELETLRRIRINALYPWELYLIRHWYLDELKYDNQDKYITIDWKLALLNTSEGSWRYDEKWSSSITLQRNPKALVLDWIEWGYWFTNIFGEPEEWWVSFSDKASKYIRTKWETKSSSKNKQIKEFKELYKQGKCSPYDSNMRRHRNVSYDNGYPAGFTCKDCGRFWID